ncbi:hypothetical protein AVEN_209814-1 [Araneus ventricosus]|uniref:Uncharacterized protein n=1 Tax=Araneus ventricosus TaxID=182803 RepID=A0A4Y2WT11_ARAVE|nr:hypothetical protein AVEN_209814-1 [Araneus ventricosus]
MVLPVRRTNTKKKRMGSHKKHDIKYFCCLLSNDGDGNMEFQESSLSPTEWTLWDIRRTQVMLNLGPIFESTQMLFWDGPRNFEPWSDDKHDI